jgi:hypothetical protein
MTPEMINNIIESNKKKSPMTFEAYYNKRFMEECKYVSETPTFRMNYIDATTQLQQAIREMALKEYKEKWPLSPIIKINNELGIDNKSVISDYDIIDEDDTPSVHSEFEDLDQDQPEPRRSKRLLKISNK